MRLEWIGIVEHLFDVITSAKKENIRKYDSYIYSTFECFVKQKRKLSCSISHLSHFFPPFRDLIMGQLVKIDAETDVILIKRMMSDANDKNLPKKQLLNIFNNVKRLELSLWDPYHLYIISLSSLLSNIKLHPSLKTVTIKLGDSRHNDLISLLYSLSIEIKRKYECVGYKIYLKERKEYGYNYVHCVIERKS